MAKLKQPCEKPCTRVIKFMTDHVIPASVGISLPPYKRIDGYRHINFFVQFSQKQSDEPPVDLGVIFAFDRNGKMGSRRYVNLEENLAPPQSPNMISISGSNAWHGSQWKISSYSARLPVMGPWVQVFPFNQAPFDRTLSIWAYLVS
ncbi:MAG: hypothetical protein GY769_26035 [bacterium]|nr:hypothetical protein [bacterium]